MFKFILVITFIVVNPENGERGYIQKAREFEDSGQCLEVRNSLRRSEDVIAAQCFKFDALLKT